MVSPQTLNITPTGQLYLTYICKYVKELKDKSSVLSKVYKVYVFSDSSISKCTKNVNFILAEIIQHITTSTSIIKTEHVTRITYFYAVVKKVDRMKFCGEKMKIFS